MKNLVDNNINKYSLSTKVRPRKSFMPRFFRRGWYISYKINETSSCLLNEKVVQKLNSVEGCLNIKESFTLFYFSYNTPYKGPIVEIGSFKGKSTAWMATALKMKRCLNKVIAIDPHINNYEPSVVPAYEEKSSYDSFIDNLERLQLLDYVQPIKDYSSNVANKWNKAIALLFIDGSHRYEDVLMDLCMWEKWVNKHGIIIMHDTDPRGRHPDVRKAIISFRKNNNRLKTVFELKNMSVFKKIRI